MYVGLVADEDVYVDGAINIALPDITLTRRHIFLPGGSMPSVVSPLPASIGDVTPSFEASELPADLHHMAEDLCLGIVHTFVSA